MSATTSPDIAEFIDELSRDPQRPTDAEVRSRILTIGGQALFAHAASHDLPAPTYVDFETDHRYPIEIRATIVGTVDQDRWLASVEVDDTSEEHNRSYSKFTWLVRLPDLGVRVTLVGVRVDVEAVAR